MKPNETISALLSQLTLDEKASLCVGKDFWRLHDIDRLGLPSIMVTDLLPNSVHASSNLESRFTKPSRRGVR